MEIQTLSNPPITEALLEIKFNPNKNVTVNKLNEFANALSTVYSNVEPVENQSFEFMYSKEEGAQHEVNIEPSGVKLTNAQKNRVIIAAIDKFVVSFMAPYTPWPDLKDTAQRLFTQYLEYAPQTEITRLGMRYINKIKLPLKENFSFQRYINTFPPIPKHELLTNSISKFETVIVLPHEDIQCVSTVRQVLLDSETDGGTEYLPFILDVDVYQNNTYALEEFNSIWDVYEKMRLKKNAIFFSTLTEEAIATYV